MTTDISTAAAGVGEIAAEAGSVTVLTGEAIGELRDVIVTAFDAADLEMTLRIKADLDLYADHPPGTDLKLLIFRILVRASQHGTVTLLLRVLLRARPARKDLRNLIARHCPEALEDAPKLNEEARNVAAGVESLHSQLDSPSVRKVVVASREKLEQLMEDVDVLANYKALHDSLHAIQLTQYSRIAEEVRHLRSEPLAAATLEDHVYQMRDICSNARKAAESLPNAAAVRAQETKWVATLEAAVAELSLAVNSLDDQAADRAARSIKNVIRQEPVRVNALMTSVATKLPLEELMQTIGKAIEDIGAGGIPAPELQAALFSLQNILPQLRGRIAEHDQWQDLENEFWGADEFVERGTPESAAVFGELWPPAKSRVESMARLDPEADWAKDSAKYAALIDRDLASQIDAARISFRRYRQAVLFRFYQVDKLLRKQCEAILAIRAPLRALLKEV